MLDTGTVRWVDACVPGGGTPRHAPGTPAAGVRLLPDGTMLVVSRIDSIVRRVAGDGRVLRRYAASLGRRWTAIDLAPDAGSFWLADGGDIYRLDLASGTVLQGPLRIPLTDSIRDLAVRDAPNGTAPVVTERPAPDALDIDGVHPLTDEVLFGLRNAPEQPANPCESGAAGTGRYSASGRAVGPYAGSFDASGMVRFGPAAAASLGLLGLDAGPVDFPGGTFEITTGAARVRGRLTLPKRLGAHNRAACAVFRGRTFPFSPVYPPDYALSG
ncbi:MAG: hypothetical protein ABR583_02870 [Gaiellaceae bacterium]